MKATTLLEVRTEPAQSPGDGVVPDLPVLVSFHIYFQLLPNSPEDGVVSDHHGIFSIAINISVFISTAQLEFNILYVNNSLRERGFVPSNEKYSKYTNLDSN